VYWIHPVTVFGGALLSDGVYESELTEVVDTLLRGGDTFVDVGGNEGYFSILAASKVKEGLVFCIEPQKRLLPVIQRNIELNAISSVSVNNIAFSDRKGSIQLYLRPSTNTGSSSFFKHWTLGGASQSVETVTLDEFVEQQSLKRIRLIKIDCEGAEGLVIKGATNSIQNHLFDFLVVDYHSQIKGMSECDEIHSKIQNAGYRLAKFVGVNVYHLPGSVQDLERMGKCRIAQSWRE
jgi:FkbM family methyltransferase